MRVQMKLGALRGMACQSISCFLLLITFTAVPCCSYSPAETETSYLSAFVGTCVEIKCKVTRYLPDEDALWFWMKYGKWDYSIQEYSGPIVYSNKPERRPISPEFIGRANYTGSTRLANTASSYYHNPSCSVRICDLREDDTGKYFFRYITDRGYKWSTEKLSLKVQVNPCPITFNKPAAVQEGHTVTLRCSTPCHSFLTIEGDLPSGLRTYQSSVRYPATADFKVSRKDDNREFTCQTWGNQNPQLVKKIRISVDYPPTNLVLSMDTEVTEGQSVSISCRVDSSPAASLTLSRTSQGSTVELNKTTDSNSLSFSVNVSSAHSGNYTCTATNRLGSRSTKGSLRVIYGPEEVRVQADPGLMVKENMTLTLRCSAQSDPPVSSFSWSRVTAGQERRVHTGTVYTVKSVSVNDTGLYSCTAHHPIRNKTSAPAQVQVQFGPKQVVLLRAEEEQGPDGSSSVTLSCSSHSFPLSLYTWYRSTEGRATKVSENINYTVPSTQPGLYYCTAKNQVSESTSEPVSLFQQQESNVYYIILALVPLLIIVCAFVVYRHKRKKSIKEECTKKSWWRSCSRNLGVENSSADGREDVQIETHRRQEVPAQQTNGTSSASAVYSSVDFPKDEQDQPGTSDQSCGEGSLFYASLHFDKAKRTVAPKPSDDDVVYSTVQYDQAGGDVYENFTTAQKVKHPSFSDNSDDEVEASYAQVNFKSKARNRES